MAQQPAPFSGEPNQPQPSSDRRSGLNWRRVAIVSSIGAALVIGLLWGASRLSNGFNGFNLGAAFGVPKDFPVYPNAALVGVRDYVGTDGKSVQATWEVNAPVGEVTAFYTQRLNQRPWEITRTNPIDGTIEFRRTESALQGIIRLSGHGQQTTIEIKLLS